MNRRGLLATVVLLLLCAMLAVIVAGKPDSAVSRHPLVIAALQPIGVPEPSWQTVILFSSRDVDLPRDTLWARWERLAEWPSWGQPLVIEARWLDLPGWRAGARFEQTLDLGFPLRRLRSVETVGAAAPGRMVSWWKDENGIKSNHVWSFEDLPGGGTRVIDLEILHGFFIGTGRQILERRLQERFDQALDGLILAARRPH